MYCKHPVCEYKKKRFETEMNISITRHTQTGCLRYTITSFLQSEYELQTSLPFSKSELSYQKYI